MHLKIHKLVAPVGMGLPLGETIERLRFDELCNSKAEGTVSTGVSRVGTLARPPRCSRRCFSMLVLAEEEPASAAGKGGKYIETVITRHMVCVSPSHLAPRTSHLPPLDTYQVPACIAPKKAGDVTGGR